jgi:aspartyl-tRNA(Asn)/glutamyl-tRNA(Gln) amidotransferase subunit B
MTTELLRELKGRDVDALPISGRSLGQLVQLLETGAVSGAAAKEVFAEMVQSGEAPGEIVAARGLARMGDDGELVSVVEAVLADHPDHVAKYRGGQQGLLGALIGQVMKRTRGRADAKRVSELLRERLND